MVIERRDPTYKQCSDTTTGDNMESVELVDLGWVMARARRNPEGSILSLVLVSPSDGQENGFEPAQSVCIFGHTNVKKLSDFLNQLMLLSNVKGSGA